MTTLVRAGQTYKIKSATTRGLTTSVVPKDTQVEVLATRLDTDGLKALVRVGRYGAAFQINADLLEQP